MPDAGDAAVALLPVSVYMAQAQSDGEMELDWTSDGWSRWGKSEGLTLASCLPDRAWFRTPLGQLVLVPREARVIEARAWHAALIVQGTGGA